MSAPHTPPTAPGSIAVATGTRPEIIKLAPVIRRLGGRALVLHSGQHWDPELSGNFFSRAGLARPDVELDGIGGRSRPAQIGAMIVQFAEVFERCRPAGVIVQGDTNTTSAAAQAASYVGIPLVHVEAGLRSFDRAMPEELNRQVVGVLADLHCAATSRNVHNLRREGVPEHRIRLTGNTIVEATTQALAGARRHPRRSASIASEPFALATIHRPENTDDPARLATILRELAGLPVRVVVPMHPRTQRKVVDFGLHALLRPLIVTGPIDHEEFLLLADRAALLVSDSGGVQEECTVLKKPLLVVRNSTERPESIEAGFAHLVQPGPEIGDLARELLADSNLSRRLRRTPCPYGDERAAELIVAATLEIADARPSVGGHRVAG
jgi:UDP-N-acetylglucosamine 2-epimerase (non-hydrolysing)